MFDPITQAQLWDILASEARRRNIGILLITHEQPLASRLCNEQWALRANE
jgi:peptide/nickel transport system ATP-binding protein